jgi:hypothetical protein
MRARSKRRPRIEQPDDAGQAAARIVNTDHRPASGKFVGYQKAARARLIGVHCRFPASDEGNLARPGGFKRRDAGNFEIARAFKASLQMPGDFIDAHGFSHSPLYDTFNPAGKRRAIAPCRRMEGYCLNRLDK